MTVEARDNLGGFVLMDVDGVEIMDDGFKVYFTDDSSKVYSGAKLTYIHN